MKIIKTSSTQITPEQGQICNDYQQSGTNTYSCNYVNGELYYKSGDIIDIESFDMALSGFLTTSNTQIIFNIFTHKSLKNVSSFTLNIMKANIRPATGGYLGSDAYVVGGYDFLSVCDIAVSKINDNIIGVKMTKKSGNFGSTNNTPISIGQGHIQIEIN